MTNQKTLLAMFAATAVAGSVGGVMVALQSQRSPIPGNNSPNQAQVSPSTTGFGDQTPTPTPTPTPTSTPTPTPPPTPTPTSTASPTPTPTPTSTPILERESVAPIVVNPPTQGCKITQAVISDPNPPLNVRSTPGVTDSNKVGTLDNGTFVSVVGQENGWFKIDRPLAGWVSQKLTRSSCSNVRERIRFPEAGTSAIVQGEIIGGGSHQYILGAAAGQTMTVEKLNSDSVFPTIISPDGQVLAGDPYTDDRRIQWVGQLPSNGDYRLEMNSNFKGFEYEFLVEIK